MASKGGGKAPAKAANKAPTKSPTKASPQASAARPDSTRRGGRIKRCRCKHHNIPPGIKKKLFLSIAHVYID